MYYVYVLISKKDKTFYYGYTKNLDHRIKEHNSGRTKSLKNKVPLALVYYEVVSSLADAIRKEKYFKTGFGRKYIKNKFMGW